MTQPKRRLLGWLTTAYRPNPEAKSFLERAETRSDGDVEVTVAVLSDREGERFFGRNLSRRGLQGIWIRVVNHSAEALRFDRVAIDPSYYTPLEAAYANHFSTGKRLLSYGLLAWMFLPLLPLLPFKFLRARRANRQMNAFFKAQAFPGGFIRAGFEVQGFMFTSHEIGAKEVHVRLLANDRRYDFPLSVVVPGLALRAEAEPASGEAESLSDAAVDDWLVRQPRCTTNQRGTVEGDPLNLVVVGSLSSIQQCFGARWDEAETITVRTCWKTFKAFFLDTEYRYSPVSPLYHAGCPQDLALQRARHSINERMHLRLWRTRMSVDGRPLWIGQVSRDIGVRFTPKTWNLTTHKVDPDVDEAREYVIDDLIAAHRVDRIGYAKGVEAAGESAPRHNLTGDTCFTDGLRALAFLSPTRTDVTYRRRGHGTPDVAESSRESR